MTIQQPEIMDSLRATVEEAVKRFYVSPLSKKRMFDPIKICELTVEQFQELFADEDGKYTSILMYRDGAIYIVDSPSYLHDYTAYNLSLSLRSSAFIRKYFFSCGSGDCKIGNVCLQPDSQYRLYSKYADNCQELLDDGTMSPAIVIEVGWSQRRRHLHEKCRMYHQTFKTEYVIGVLRAEDDFFEVHLFEMGVLISSQTVHGEDIFSLKLKQSILALRMNRDFREAVLAENLEIEEINCSFDQEIVDEIHYNK